MRSAPGLLVLALLAGCADKPVKPVPPAAEPVADAPRAAAEAAAPVSTVPPACLQVREHRDEDYTPGGLYAPGVSDSAPEHALDISSIPEPVPRPEPRAAYGNRSPYTVLGKSYRVRASAEGYVERGVASWYGQKFHGRQTSSREIYDMCSFSAAHKTLPLPSYVRVTNLDNGRSAVVRVNDRGPFHAGRIIDLSYAAAVKLGVDRTGTARVEVRALSGGAAESATAPAPAAVAPPREYSGRQIVQVGAYRDKDNARRIAAQLEDAGIDDVEIEDVRVEGGKVWRVRVGPLAPRAVDGVLARIRGLGLPSPRVFSE
jgi:rare lipoprotein A